MTSKEALEDLIKRNEYFKKNLINGFHIGTITIDKIKELVERDTPMLPIKQKWNNTENYCYVCPKCEEWVAWGARTDKVFCQNCGQRLDWSEL